MSEQIHHIYIMVSFDLYEARVDQVIDNVQNTVTNFIDGQQYARVADIVFQRQKMFEQHQAVDVGAHGVVKSALVN